MRHGRAKQARKTLQFFQRTLGLHAPLHVLLDGPFVVAFAQHNLPLEERVARLLQVQATTISNSNATATHSQPRSSLIFVTAESVLQELQTLIEKCPDKDKKATLQQAHDWMVQHCSIIVKKHKVPKVSSINDWTSKKRLSVYVGELSDAGRDLLAVLTESNGIARTPTAASESTTKEETDATASSTNKHHHKPVTPPLLVASQDEALLHVARQSGRVPVMRLARGSVLLLEQPSGAAQSAQDYTERTKWSKGAVPEQEQALVDLIKQEERRLRGHKRTEALPPHLQRRQRHKAKGPNPLSCKRKKGGDQDDIKSKKQRRNKG